MSGYGRQGGVSRGRMWAGRVLFGWFAIFFLFDAGVKVLGLNVATDATVRLGLSTDLIVPIGVVELVCVGLYLIPRTSVVGALLLTAFLGGATAIQVRVHDAWFAFPILMSVCSWGALWMRDPRVSALLHIALRESSTSSVVTKIPRVVRATA